MQANLLWLRYLALLQASSALLQARSEREKRQQQPPPPRDGPVGSLSGDVVEEMCPYEIPNGGKELLTATGDGDEELWYRLAEPPAPHSRLLRAPLPAEVQLAVFGDSFVEDNSGRPSEDAFAHVVTWPHALAASLRWPVAGNFATGGSETDRLGMELENASRALNGTGRWPQVLAIVHSGVNDFLSAEHDYSKMDILKYCTFGFKKKGKTVVERLRDFLVKLHSLGVRHILVSDVPLSSAIPRFHAFPGIDKKCRWESKLLAAMLEGFRAMYPEVDVGQLQECLFLHEIVNGTAHKERRALFLKDEFHPSSLLHKKYSLLVESLL